MVSRGGRDLEALLERAGSEFEHFIMTCCDVVAAQLPVVIAAILVCGSVFGRGHMSGEVVIIIFFGSVKRYAQRYGEHAQDTTNQHSFHQLLSVFWFPQDATVLFY